MVCQYMDTLCITQKQTHLTSSLLQDIVVFNEHDSAKLWEWLTYIETAVVLTSESQPKLDKVKSKGLTLTLGMEAINSEKTWDDIKDLLRLKLYNASIHKYTSLFMDIQKWEKESLAPYVHQFKMETKACNFTNDAATIKIFIKGLRNAQNLVARIYKRSTNTKGCNY